jgi:MFS family permease
MNPVLRENLEVLVEGRHVLTVYFYLLVFLAPVEFTALYSQSLGEQMWRGSGLLLKVSATAALVLIVYFALRLANQEYAPERFKRLGDWLHEGRHAVGVVARGRVTSLLLHISCLVLLSAPLLAWAAAISHTPLSTLLAALALIAFYAFCYGVWGLVVSTLFEGERENREFVVRLFTLIVVAAALAIYLPLDPVVYLWAVVGRDELEPLDIAGWSWSADSVHFAFHLVLGGCGLIAHRWVLKRIPEREHG